MDALKSRSCSPSDIPGVDRGRGVCSLAVERGESGSSIRLFLFDVVDLARASAKGSRLGGQRTDVSATPLSD